MDPCPLARRSTRHLNLRKLVRVVPAEHRQSHHDCADLFGRARWWLCLVSLGCLPTPTAKELLLTVRESCSAQCFRVLPNRNVAVCGLCSIRRGRGPRRCARSGGARARIQDWLCGSGGLLWHSASEPCSYALGAAAVRSAGCERADIVQGSFLICLCYTVSYTTKLYYSMLIVGCCAACRHAHPLPQPPRQPQQLMGLAPLCFMTTLTMLAPPSPRTKPEATMMIMKPGRAESNAEGRPEPCPLCCRRLLA
jgi:hypothetical protein